MPDAFSLNPKSDEDWAIKHYKGSIMLGSKTFRIERASVNAIKLRIA